MNTKNTSNNIFAFFGVVICTLMLILACEEDDSFKGNIPAIVSFSPLEGKTGTMVTVNGTKLSGATEVRIGDVKAPIVSNTDTSITFNVPEGAVPGKILMINSEGASRSRNSFNAIVEGAATISEISSRSVQVGDKITIKGSLFTTTKGVKIGGVDAVFEIISDSEISVVVGDSPLGLSSIEITNNAGALTTDASLEKFYVIALITPSEFNESFTGPKDDLVFTTGSDAENDEDKSGWSEEIASHPLLPAPIDGAFYTLGGTSDTGDSGSYAGQVGTSSSTEAGTFSEFFAGGNNDLGNYYFNIQMNFQGIPDDYPESGLLCGLRVRFDVLGIDVDGDGRTSDQLMEYRGSRADFDLKGYAADPDNGWYSLSIPFEAFLNPGESGASWNDYNMEQNVTRFAVAARREHNGDFSMSMDNISISKGGPMYLPNK